MDDGSPGRRWWDLAAIVTFTVVSRWAYFPSAVMGFDGPEYVNALKLDSTFNVPMPGNIGYVLLGKLFTLMGADPIAAYAWVGTLLSAAGAAYIYLLGVMVFRRSLALAVAFAVMTNAMVWYHGVIMQSYIVWLAAMPAIGYHALRMVRERSLGSVIGASLATGLSTILRPDLVVFGGPLLGVGLVLAWKGWEDGWRRVWIGRVALATAVCASCCLVWFLLTAHILGGIERYLAMVRGKNAWHETFGVAEKGLVEGLARNGVKYAMFMLWGVHVAIVPAFVGAIVYARRARLRWRAWLLVLAWTGPSLYFSLVIFMGNAGLTFPVTPLVYLAAGAGAAVVLGQRRAAWALAAVAVINTAQFTLTPILPLTDQRAALLNHMFFGYSGRGLRRAYTYQLEDFGIDRSLKNTLHQFVDPGPLPRKP